MIIEETRIDIWKQIEIKPIKLSSTIIRDKIKNGEKVEEFFKKEVLEYINKNGLYKL